MSGGQRQVVVGDEIVLSAGPIGSPHLLMLSGIGPADQLRAAGVTVRHDLPGVGQNLRDHPHVGALWLSVRLGQHAAFANIVGDRIGPSDEVLDSPAALET